MYLLSHLFLMLTKNAEKASKERADAYLPKPPTSMISNSACARSIAKRR